MLASTITDLYDLSIPPNYSITVRDVACSRHSLIIIGWDIFFAYRFDSSEWSDFHYVPSSALLIDTFADYSDLLIGDDPWIISCQV